MEINPEEVYRNVTNILKQISTAIPRGDVLLSISCMAPVLVLLGKTKRPIRPAILYNDLRTSAEVDEINEKIGTERLLRINGNQANIQQYGPKLLWLRRNEPAISSAIKKVFDLCTYLIWRLTGEEVIDFTIAEETGLLDYSRLNWSDVMLAHLDLDSAALPSLERTVHTVDITSTEVKSSLGMRGRRVAVTSGCVDAVSSPIGMGLVDEGHISLELGTTGIIYTPTLSPNPDRRLYLDLSPVDKMFLVGGGTAASGIFHEWILRLVMNNKADFERAEKLARASKPGSNGIVILPYILGERTPIFDMLARAIIFGLREEDTRNDILRASMEAIAYSFLHHVRVMREKGYRIESGTITGGGAKSPLFREIMADVLGLPLTHTPTMSTTIGTAYIGYMAAGLKTKWEDAKAWSAASEEIQPNPRYRKLYDTMFSIYLKLYEDHREDFKRVSKLSA
jgi:xylulokinase